MEERSLERPRRSSRKRAAPPPGWLAEEQIDGQRYRTLVSLLDGDAGEQATLNDPGANESLVG